MKKIFVISLVVLIIIPTIIHAENVYRDALIPKELFHLDLNRKPIEDVIIIPDSNPFFGIIGSYIACWYDTGEIRAPPL